MKSGGGAFRLGASAVTLIGTESLAGGVVLLRDLDPRDMTSEAVTRNETNFHSSTELR